MVDRFGGKKYPEEWKNNFIPFCRVHLMVSSCHFGCADRLKEGFISVRHRQQALQSIFLVCIKRNFPPFTSYCAKAFLNKWMRAMAVPSVWPSLSTGTKCPHPDRFCWHVAQGFFITIVDRNLCILLSPTLCTVSVRIQVLLANLFFLHMLTSACTKFLVLS